MIRDCNGEELRPGGHASLLCEILEASPEIIRLRVMNSEMELAVGVSPDEVLGLVADSELTAFFELPGGDEPHEVKISAFE